MMIGGLCLRLLVLALHSIIPKVLAHVAAVKDTHARVGVEIGREGNLLMRRDGEEIHASQSELAETSHANVATHQRPVRGQVAVEAEEAFESPSKIDDSTLALWTPRMPAFIEKYPEFYGVFFACSGLAVLGYVWFHIYREDLKAEESRQRRAIANARKMVAHAAAYNQKRAEAFAPHDPNAIATRKDRDAVEEAKTEKSRPITAVLKAVVSSSKGKSNSPPGENMRLPKFITARPKASPREVEKNSAKSLPGENMKLPKFVANHAQDSTSASGNTSPRSVVSQSSGPQFSKIKNGTVLMARTPTCVFDNSATHEIGYLYAGQQVVAVGAPSMREDFTWVPIRPTGVVDLKVMQMMHE